MPCAHTSDAAQVRSAVQLAELDRCGEQRGRGGDGGNGQYVPENPPAIHPRPAEQREAERDTECDVRQPVRPALRDQPIHHHPPIVYRRFLPRAGTELERHVTAVHDEQRHTEGEGSKPPPGYGLGVGQRRGRSGRAPAPQWLRYHDAAPVGPGLGGGGGVCGGGRGSIEIVPPAAVAACDVPAAVSGRNGAAG